MRTLSGLIVVVAACSFDGGAAALTDAAPDAEPSETSIRRLTELETLGTSAYDDPMLTRDLELFFAGPGLVGGGQDLYRASYNTQTEQFNPPVRIDELSTNTSESTLWISPDGLTIIFGRVGEDAGFGVPSLDMYIATRPSLQDAFGAAELLGQSSTGLLHSPAEEGVGALSSDGETYYFSSNRSGEFGIYEATRSSQNADFDTVRRLDDISSAGSAESSAKLSPDGDSLHFAVRRGNGEKDVVVAMRDATTDEFANPTVVSSIDFTADNDDFALYTSNLGVFASLRETDSLRIYLVQSP